MYKSCLHITPKQSITKLHSGVYKCISSFCTLASFRKFKKVEGKGLDKALKILDFIIPKTGEVIEECHHRLVQSCMRDVLETDQQKHPELEMRTVHTKLTEQFRIRDEVLHGDSSVWWRTKILVKDSLLLFLESHKRGIDFDATILSCTMSSCGVRGDIGMGVQLHAISVKFGFDKSISVGSSLISLYSKTRQLDNAYQVFDEMPTRNIVSWTAIIAGYAQHQEVGICIQLFNSMRQFMLNPNDFTYATVLSACTNNAYAVLGRSIHCLEIRTGFNSYTHVSNALISMYAKCGGIEEAHYVFEKMPHKDLISWNTMIFGYAQYGLAEQALGLLKELDKQKIVPDAISFLGVLSSCRHAGFVEQAHRCFDSMLEHGIKPELDHYSCIIDLLGRAGLLEEAVVFIEKMPIPPNAVIWGSLLSSCRVHGNVWIGIRAAENRLLLEPGCASTHVQLANLYASAGCWNHAAKIRKLMKERGLKTSPGYSWVEIGDMVYTFIAEDRSNTQFNGILSILDCLEGHMKLDLLVVPSPAS